MKIENALVSNILNRSQRYFAHVTTVTLSWRVQNIVVIGREYFTPQCFEFSSNFEFDRNMLSGTGAWDGPVLWPGVGTQGAPPGGGYSLCDGWYICAAVLTPFFHFGRIEHDLFGVFFSSTNSKAIFWGTKTTNFYKNRSFWPQIQFFPRSFWVQFSAASGTPPSVFRPSTPPGVHPHVQNLEPPCGSPWGPCSHPNPDQDTLWGQEQSTPHDPHQIEDRTP